MAAVTAPVGVAETSSLQRIFKIQAQSKCPYWESLSPTVREACVNPDVSRTVGENTAFDPAGEIQKKWNNEVYPAVKDLLTDQLVWIYKYEKARIPYCFSLYMIGKAWDSTHPTIVTTCIRSKVAERITKLLRDKLARFRLGFSYLANSTHLTRPAGTLTFRPGGEKLIAAYLRYYGAEQEEREAEADHVSCGLPLFACDHAGRVLSYATSGGCLWVDNSCHFMTVSHVMCENLPQTEDSPTHLSTDMCDAWSDISSIPSDDEEYATDSGGSAAAVRDTMLLSDREYILKVRQIHSLQTSHVLSHPIDHDMDWAMFTSESLHDDLSTTFNCLTLPDGSTVVVQDIDSQGPQNKALLVTNGIAEEVNASSTKVGIFLPNSTGVIDAWPIEYKSCKTAPDSLISFTDKPSAPGQCGSWVLSPDGNLYGTLVLYAEGYGQSYILPITQTLNSMRTRNPEKDIRLVPGQRIQPNGRKTRDSANESCDSASTAALSTVPSPISNLKSSSCTNCRARHFKCDGAPECSRCKLESKPCIYVASRRGQRKPGRNVRYHIGSSDEEASDIINKMVVLEPTKEESQSLAKRRLMREAVESHARFQQRQSVLSGSDQISIVSDRPASIFSHTDAMSIHTSSTSASVWSENLSSRNLRFEPEVLEEPRGRDQTPMSIFADTSSHLPRQYTQPKISYAAKDSRARSRSRSRIRAQSTDSSQHVIRDRREEPAIDQEGLPPQAPKVWLESAESPLPRDLFPSPRRSKYYPTKSSHF